MKHLPCYSFFFFVLCACHVRLSHSQYNVVQCGSLAGIFVAMALQCIQIIKQLLNISICAGRPTNVTNNLSFAKKNNTQEIMFVEKYFLL